MKHVQACLSVRKDGESSFHNCGGPVNLVQAYLCVGNTIQRRFPRRKWTVKNVQASVCSRKDRSLYHCGSPVKLVQACLYARNTLQRRFNRQGGAVKHVQACLCG